MATERTHGNAHAELTGNVRNAKFTLRQDRHLSDGLMLLEVGTHQCPVLNFSTFGLAIQTSAKFEPGDILSETKLTLAGDLIGELSFIVKRSQKSGENWEYGLEVMTQAIPVAQIHLMEEIRSSLQQIEDQYSQYTVLPAEFRYLVLALRSSCEQVEALCKSYEAKPFRSRAEREEAMALVINKIGSRLHQELRDANQRLQTLVQGQSEEILKLGFQFFRDNLGQFIFQSPFTKRSYEKPRGYAGDFEMMNLIYRSDDHASSLFGSCMERGVLLQEEPNAVRNRSRYLADKILAKVRSTNGTLEFMSVACGPAEEVKLAVQALSQDQLNRITFHLLDQDEDALKYAQKNIRASALSAGKSVTLNLLNRGIKEVIVEGLKADKYDLIYSAGLFDYFSDPVAMRAARVLAAGLKSAGRLVIGNFNITSPNWFGMLSLFDWRLILRGESDLKRLFAQDGFDFQVEAEAKNINLFCVLERK